MKSEDIGLSGVIVLIVILAILFSFGSVIMDEVRDETCAEWNHSTGYGHICKDQPIAFNVTNQGLDSLDLLSQFIAIIVIVVIASFIVVIIAKDMGKSGGL